MKAADSCGGPLKRGSCEGALQRWDRLDGEEALRVASAMLFDPIVLDMLPRKLRGPEILHALKDNPKASLIQRH